MKQKNMTIQTLVSIISGALAALLVCSGFFFYLNYFDKPARTAELPTKVEEAPVPTPKRPGDPPPVDREIAESEVESLTIETVYPKFFDEASGCRQTYNEKYGNADGVYSSSSPCRISLTFSRDGRAGKSIVSRRYDARVRQWTDTESKIWEAEISDEQFERLNAAVVGSEAFKSWRTGTSLYVSNCSVSVKYRGGTRTPMMNLDDKAEALPEIVSVFQELDKTLAWQPRR
jgi:hypothetical protein